MPFIFKKIISAFILPCGLYVSLFFFVGFYFLVKKKMKISVLFFSFGSFIWILSSPFLGNILICSLEKEYYREDISGDAIVVLGGHAVSNETGNFLSEDSLSRLAASLPVYKKIKKPIILSGGKVYSAASFADAGEKFLIDTGINPKGIIKENKSKDTFENSLYVKEICDLRKIKKPVIITQASHLKRAVYSFKKAGFEDVGYFASSFSCSQKSDFMSFLPSSGLSFRIWLRENLGLLSRKFFDIIFEKEKK